MTVGVDASRIETDTRPAKAGLLRVSGWLTTVGAVGRATSLITSPLLARALGPSGRGELAAIIVPLTLIPWLLDLGLPSYASRTAARGRPLGSLVGTLGTGGLVLGLGGMALAFPLAQLFGRGRHVVEVYILIGLLLLPVAMISNILVGLLVGLERWTRIYVVQLILPVMTLLGTVTLYVTGRLSVDTAAATFLVAASLTGIPLLALIRDARPLRVDRLIAREGLSFGIKAWLGSLASITNLRLDQLLMIFLVTQKQLGLYVVAVNMAGMVSLLTGGVSTAVIPRAARDDPHVTARALRATVAVLLVGGVGLAVVTPWFVPAFFGASFRAAVPIIWILIASEVVSQARGVLNSGLVAAGRAGAGAAAELVALFITVPGLLLLLRPFAAEGAATVSVVAYSASFIYLLHVAKHHFGSPLRSMLVIDHREARELVRSGAAQLKSYSARVTSRSVR